jgi:hypothetical protein
MYSDDPITAMDNHDQQPIFIHMWMYRGQRELAAGLHQIAIFEIAFPSTFCCTAGRDLEQSK